MATVSLALDERETSRVSPETRERILALAKDLNYQPNYVARTLVTRKSYTLGLVLTTLRNPFYAELAHDVLVRAEEQGYHLFTCAVRGSLSGELAAIEGLINRGVDGLVVCSCLRQDPAIKFMLERKAPFVLAMRTVDQEPGDPLVDFVGVDNRSGAYQAMAHLIKLGHARIGLLTGPEQASTGHQRRVGALAALAAHGLELSPELIMEGDFQRGSGRELARRLLQLRQRPTAIFAGNDHMAIGVLDALAEAGLRCPEDLALIGFDDIEMAGLPGIELTTVSQKKSVMGQIAVDHLIEKIREGESYLVKQIILEPILVVRRTCGRQTRRGEPDATTTGAEA